MFTKCFSCNDQGLYERYCLFFILVLLVAPFIFKAWRIVEGRSAINDVTAIAYASLMFFVAHVFCFFLHITVYASNGHGVGVLVFFAQFVDFMFTSLFFCAANLMIHGVYITKPGFPIGEDRQRYITSTFIFVVTNLMAAVMTGFLISGAELSPFALFHKSYAFPYVVARFGCGGWLVMKGLETAKQAHGQEKQAVVSRMALAFGGWCMIVPFFTAFSSEQDWHYTCIRIQVVNFIAVLEMFYHLWPGRVGWVFNEAKPSQANQGLHPYSEFGPRDI